MPDLEPAGRCGRLRVVSVKKRRPDASAGVGFGADLGCGRCRKRTSIIIGSMLDAVKVMVIFPAVRSRAADLCHNESTRIIMADKETPESKTNRFETVATVLIAIVSTVIALVASQSAVASGNATEAQHDGVLAKINLERVDGSSRAQIAHNERAFSIYRSNRDLYSLTVDYAVKAETAGNAGQGTALRQEAARQLEDSNNAYRFIDSNYLVKDPATGEYTSFDEQNYLNDQRQSASVYEDIAFDDNFAEADGLRAQSLTLGISLLAWFIALMFLTWAEISKSALRWVWLAAGVLLALGLVAIYVITGVSRLIGLA